MVEVRLARSAPGEFDNQPGGRVWIDGVALRPE